MNRTVNKRRISGKTVYTTLLLIALVALILGIGYVWYRDSQLTGTWKNPFQMQNSTSVSMIEHVAIDNL